MGSDHLRLGAQFVALVLGGWVSGVTLGIWQGHDPAALSPDAYLAVHQDWVAGLNVLQPVLGALTILAALVLAVLARGSRRVLGLYILAILLLAAAGLITRFVNQPINAEIMQWTSGALPEGWEALRDRWWHWHVVRTIASLAGQVVLVAGVLADRRRRLGDVRLRLAERSEA